MPLSLIRQDITKLSVDAIVNAANEGLRAGGGVCGAIFAAAGHDELQRACDKIGHVDTGSAVATPGFALPARHIIHTAGPVWHGGTHGERELLASCYRSSLALACELGDTSIAFPLISSGIYAYPPAEALAVAVAEIRSFLVDHPDLEVTLCLFDRKATTLTQGLFGAIESYVDDVYVDSRPYGRKRVSEAYAKHDGYADALHDGTLNDWSFDYAASAPTTPPAGSHAAAPAAAPMAYGSPEPSSPAQKAKKHWWQRKKDEEETPTSASKPMAAQSAKTLDEALAHLDAPFSQTLLAMIDERGLTDAQVYARANLSRQYFSKLRSGKVNPSKRVVLALAVALKLPLDETRMLLERAGHALTHASKFDVIVEWFIMHGRFDIFEINEALFTFDQQLLGAS